MAHFCFMLDLLSLSPPVLKNLKQSLLQLANLYAISPLRPDSRSPPLKDRIGLCYLHKSKAASTVELRVAYNPQGKYNLRDFHYAVNSLPAESFLPELREFGALDHGNSYEVLANLLTDASLFSCGSKDTEKKVVLITSCPEGSISAIQEFLSVAAERYISIELVLLEHEASQMKGAPPQVVKEFADKISNLKNCSLQSYFPNAWVLCALVKRWLQEIKANDQSLQAKFLFKYGLLGCVNQIFCSLFPSAQQIIDGFSPCQTCRCHGLAMDSLAGHLAKWLCPFTLNELEACDLVENAVRIGEQTVLFLPSFESCPNLKPLTGPPVFNVVGRTKLASLSEGVVMGTPYVATCTKADIAFDGFDKFELNLQLYHGLCQALYSLDEGLICSSNCNVQTMMEATFECFYLLQPSENGPMLLRRLAGSEETLPIPEVVKLRDSYIPAEVEASIQKSLLKLESREYNPLLYERGFHPKLNWLVKESLHLGSISSSNGIRKSSKESVPVSDSNLVKAYTQPLPEVRSNHAEDKTQSTMTAEEDMVAAGISQEWEELIVDEVGKNYSPTCLTKPKPDNLAFLSSDIKPLDEKTCKILERLETPRQWKTRDVSSPVIALGAATRDASGSMKRPLVPFGSSTMIDHRVSSSQPMKPNFQRAKRKLR